MQILLKIRVTLTSLRLFSIGDKKSGSLVHPLSCVIASGSLWDKFITLVKTLTANALQKMKKILTS